MIICLRASSYSFHVLNRPFSLSTIWLHVVAIPSSSAMVGTAKTWMGVGGLVEDTYRGTNYVEGGDGGCLFSTLWAACPSLLWIPPLPQLTPSSLFYMRSFPLDISLRQILSDRCIAASGNWPIQRLPGTLYPSNQWFATNVDALCCRYYRHHLSSSI